MKKESQQSGGKARLIRGLEGPGPSRRTRLSRPRGEGTVVFSSGLHLEEPVERQTTEYGGTER